MNPQELPVLFPCEGSAQVGIFHLAEKPAKTGVVMVVAGGPQYRVGRARQWVGFAKYLANAGYPVLRFDYRGLGDSAGIFLGFEAIDTDIRSAIDAMKAKLPDIENIILWGECSGASSIMMYAWQDPRVKGMVICNPWVSDEATQAQTVIKYYYLRRLQEKSFWLKIIKGQLNILNSITSILNLWQQSKLPKTTPQVSSPEYHTLRYQDKMLEGFSRFPGKVLFIKEALSLTGKEFDMVVAASGRWQKALQRDTVTHTSDQVRKSDGYSLKAYSLRFVDDALQWLTKQDFN
ncbi:MAG: hydrolase 1, exosortase A system-associated [Methylococcales bacterium]|nr:hydrolase 1, exosortase A system-associated [Methylococcales bacterium]